MRNEHRPIRVGIMCNGTSFREWQARCLEYLLALDFVRFCLLIIDENVTNRSLVYMLKRFLANLNRALFYFYMAFIYRPRTKRWVNLSNLLSGIPRIRCKTMKKGKFSEYFSDDDVKTIREYGLDVILRFGFGIIRGDILSVARYGVWSFHHGDEQKYRGGPAGFWEIYYGENAAGCILQRLTERLDGGIVLKKGFVATVKYSLARNMERVHHKGAQWPALVCRDIYNGIADYLDAPPVYTEAPIYHLPNNAQMFTFIGKILRNFMIAAWQVLFYRPQWNIGIMHQPLYSLLEPDSKLEKIHWAPTRENYRYLADCFGIARGSSSTILCEDFDHRYGKGMISSVHYTDEGVFSSPQCAISSPCHMSYPYLVQHEGETYCIPEMVESREISIYKAERLPDSWIKICTILSDVAAVDPTVFQYGGLWWLFFTDQEEGSDTDLFVWYASDLFGPWKPHASNPVKIDVRSARPAGTPFIHNGQLYRPSQDCSRTYYRRVVLNQITQLTPTLFREEPLRCIEPLSNSPFPEGSHTVSSVGDFTLVDGVRYVFTPAKAVHFLKIFKGK